MQRMTKQRTAIMQALKDGHSFISAQDLHAKLSNEGINVGLATVYRNLQELATRHDIDTAREEYSDVQLFRYCGSDQPHHHHLICRSCGTSEEIQAEEVEEWAGAIAKKHGFADVTHSLELYGLCLNCQSDN